MVRFIIPVLTRLIHKSSDRFALQHTEDVLRIGQREYNDRQVIVHGKAGRRRIHHSQTLRQHFLITDRVVLYSRRVLFRIGGINTVDILGQQDRVCLDLRRPQNSRRISGEEWMAGTASEQDNTAVLQIRGYPRLS